MAKKTAAKKITAAEPVPMIVFMAATNWDPKHVTLTSMDDSKATSRAKFMRHVKEFHGKPLADWTAAVAKKAPATSSNAEKPYTAKQWQTWFVKAGIIEISNA